MRKVMTVSMVKNEADIIESFVRYHLHIVDGMVVLDNGSTDRTITILERLRSERLPVFLKRDTSLEYAQAAKTTRLMYETFLEHEPDLLLPLDADEFVVSADGRTHPRIWLDRLDLNRVHYNRMREYVPDGGNDETERLIPRKITSCRGDDDWYKVIVPRKVAEQYLPRLTMGNHDLDFDGPWRKWVPKEVASELRLAHFAIRSFEQAKSKLLVGFLNYLTMPERKKGEGAYWKKWFQLLKSSPDMSYPEFIAGFFENKPAGKLPVDLSFCHSLDIRYTGAGEVHAVRNLLEFGERLAREYAAWQS